MAAALTLSMSCGEKSLENAGTSEGSDSETSTETEELTTGLEAKDLGGMKFRVITQKPDNYCRRTDDISSDGIDGNILNDKIYERNNRRVR